MSKVAFIIPGWGDSVKWDRYKKIVPLLVSKKIRPVLVDIDWNHKTMTDYVNQFTKIYEKNKAKEVYVIGFSWGAIIGLLASQKINPKVLILCSLSPFFNEDLEYLRKRWKNKLGKRRLEDFRTYSFKKIAKNVRCRTILLAGTEEHKLLLRRVNDANNKLKNSELVIIRGAKHNISRREYLDCIREIIYSL